MISITERKGKQINFHPSNTIIRGENDTGKSSILKTIYQTMGATPKTVHPRWSNSEVRSAIDFVVDGSAFTILRSGDRYTVFDSTRKVLISTTSITRGLSPFFSDLFNFRLQLRARSGDLLQATPAFLFLPFYIDQDAGWTGNWSSFAHLSQFQNWRYDVISYHLGIRPNEYYAALNALGEVDQRIQSIQQKMELLTSFQSSWREALATTTFSISFDSYQNEIQELLVACNHLKIREESLKSELLNLYNHRSLLETQLLIVRATARELGKDYSYAVTDLPDDEVECPTCGTLHRNSFVERFAMARDEMRCLELETELKDDLDICDAHISRLTKNQEANITEMQNIQSILRRSQEEVTLQILIQNEGKREMRELLAEQISSNLQEHDELARTRRNLQGQVQHFEDSNRKSLVERRHFERMTNYLRELRVLNLPAKDFRRIDARIPETGSDLPRALLAYYYSVFAGIHENSAGISFPFVIDSPRQQDQDSNNWQRILEFIREYQPEGSQLILSVSDAEGIEFSGDVIDLKTIGSVLSEEEYISIRGDMTDLFQLSNSTGLFATD